MFVRFQAVNERDLLCLSKYRSHLKLPVTAVLVLVRPVQFVNSGSLYIQKDQNVSQFSRRSLTVTLVKLLGKG